MSELSLWLAIGAGGAIGALLRSLIYLAVRPSKTSIGGGRWSRLGTTRATLLVNVAGSFLLGLLVGSGFEALAGTSPAVRAFWTTGICGALTTFSTLCADGVGLSQRGDYSGAGGMILANLVLGVGALIFGTAIGS